MYRSQEGHGETLRWRDRTLKNWWLFQKPTLK